jgi:hypothetical protein
VRVIDLEREGADGDPGRGDDRPDIDTVSLQVVRDPLESGLVGDIGYVEHWGIEAVGAEDVVDVGSSTFRLAREDVNGTVGARQPDRDGESDTGRSPGDDETTPRRRHCWS